MSEEKVKIEARVREYVPNAMQEDYDEGFASYDASRLEILAPIEFRGRQLMVFHDATPPPGSWWRKPGARVRASMARSSLTGNETLFAGSLNAIRELPPEEK